MYSKDPEWLSIGEAADLIQVSRDTLRRWEKKGKIKSYRSPTNRRMYKRSELASLYQTTESPIQTTSSATHIESTTDTSNTEPIIQPISTDTPGVQSAYENHSQAISESQITTTQSEPETPPSQTVAQTSPQIPMGLARPSTAQTPQINPFTVSQTPSTPAEPNQHMNTDSTQPNPQFESHQNIHTQTNQPNQQTTPTQSTFSNPFAVPPTAPINEPTTTPRNPFVKQQQYPNAPTHTPTYSYKQETFSTVAQQQVLNNPRAATTTVVGVGSTAYHSPQNATPAQIYSQNQQPMATNNSYEDFDYDEEYETENSSSNSLKSLKIITGVLITILIFLGIGIFIIIFTSYN